MIEWGDAGQRARALVIRPELRRGADDGRVATHSPTARLDEANGLARAISLEVVASEIVPLSNIHPATFIGRGKCDDLGSKIQDLEVGLVIVDCALSPIQQRNLERTWESKVIDRTGLILEIFGERAQTREGVLQVELAHLEYQQSRLVRSWTHLERQRGGFGFLGGPGERQIEADRRVIRERMGRIKKDLAKVRKTRTLHRTERKKVPFPVVALVGYTNAGKSTLFNRLTSAEVRAEDLLFATLDPTMRAVRLPSGRKIILSDTVGFISDLPTELVASFRATLEEVLEANIIVHVIDAANAGAEAQQEDVLGVLGDLGVDATGGNLIRCLNKIDSLDEPGQIPRAIGAGPIIELSALTGQGVEAFLSTIDDMLRTNEVLAEILLPRSEGEALAWLHARSEVLEQDDQIETEIRLRVRLSEAAMGRFNKRFPEISVAVLERP